MAAASTARRIQRASRDEDIKSLSVVKGIFERHDEKLCRAKCCTHVENLCTLRLFDHT
jgi:hypothetical protein